MPILLAASLQSAGIRRWPFLAGLASPLPYIAIALSALLWPVVTVHLPPLLDYPNHMARLWLLAGGMAQAPLDTIYAVDWAGASTNIGPDLVAAIAGWLHPGTEIGPTLLAAAVMLPPLGAVLLNRTVFGGWHWWQIGFAVLAWNTTLLAGFLGFQVGLGLALVAAGLDPWITRRAAPVPIFAARAALGCGLLVFHIFAAGFYAALLAGLAFGAKCPSSARVGLWRRPLQRAALATGAGLIVPLLLLFVLAPTLPGTTAPSDVFGWGGYTIVDKANTIATAIATYDIRIDLACALLLWLAARAFCTLEVHSGLALSAAGLAVLAIVTPSSAAGTAYVDWRLPIMAALTLVAAIRPSISFHSATFILPTLLLCITVSRTAWITSIWQNRQTDVAAVEDVLSLVPAGAKVLPAQHDARVNLPVGRLLIDGTPTYLHLASAAVYRQRAFIPTLFTTAGKQPLIVQAPYKALSVPEGVPAPVWTLSSYNSSPRADYIVGYVRNWRSDFDFLLVLNADVPDDHDERAIQDLRLIADRGFARLYAIRHTNRE